MPTLGKFITISLLAKSQHLESGGDVMPKISRLEKQRLRKAAR